MNHLNFAGDRPLDFIALGRAGVDLYARERDTPLDIGDNIVPLAYFNRVKLKKGETFSYRLEEYESVSVLAAGTCDFDVAGAHFANVGRRASLWAGRPDAVYVPLNTRVTLTGVSAEAEIFIAGGKAETQYKPFRVTPEEVDTVQYGSDDTKTHRKILHILGQNAARPRGPVAGERIVYGGRRRLVRISVP